MKGVTDSGQRQVSVAWSSRVQYKGRPYFVLTCGAHNVWMIQYRWWNNLLVHGAASRYFLCGTEEHAQTRGLWLVSVVWLVRFGSVSRCSEIWTLQWHAQLFYQYVCRPIPLNNNIGTYNFDAAFCTLTTIRSLWLHKSKRWPDLQECNQIPAGSDFEMWRPHRLHSRKSAGWFRHFGIVNLLNCIPFTT
jgi:hypothetical protein